MKGQVNLSRGNSMKQINVLFFISVRRVEAKRELFMSFVMHGIMPPLRFRKMLVFTRSLCKDWGLQPPG